MKSHIRHEIVNLVLAIPILVISVWIGSETPDLLNPFNHGYMPDLWILVLPALLASAGIVVNNLLAIIIYFYQGTPRQPSTACSQCGYDLRATPDRCPECGTIPPPKKEIVAT